MFALHRNLNYGVHKDLRNTPFVPQIISSVHFLKVCNGLRPWRIYFFVKNWRIWQVRHWVVHPPFYGLVRIVRIYNVDHIFKIGEHAAGESDDDIIMMDDDRSSSRRHKKDRRRSRSPSDRRRGGSRSRSGSRSKKSKKRRDKSRSRSRSRDRRRGGKGGRSRSREREREKAGLAIKKPNPKKPTQKNPPKNPLKMSFGVFLTFLFFMKIIQTFLFETDFLWTNKT